MIRRQDVEIVPLTDGDYALLAAFASGSLFAQAAEAAASAQADFDLTEALLRHVQQGNLAEFELN